MGVYHFVAYNRHTIRGGSDVTWAGNEMPDTGAPSRHGPPQPLNIKSHTSNFTHGTTHGAGMPCVAALTRQEK